MNKLKTNFKIHFTITPLRVATLGMLLALTMTLKYVFGFVPGIEVVSFLFIIVGIFLPLMDLLLLIAAFNFLIVTIYGFGLWWIMYWIIWPVDALLSKLISKKIQNKFVFGVWGFIAGASVGFWYFWPEWITMGQEFARLNLITAIPINAIEGITTMLMIILLGPMIAHLFKKHSMKIWGIENAFQFKEVKKPKLNILLTIFACIISLSGIITLYVKNNYFFEWKVRETRSFYKFKKLNTMIPTTLQYLPQDITSLDGSRTIKSGGSNNQVLLNSNYNYIHKVMQDIPGPQAALVVIANHKFYTEIINLNTKIKHVTDLMDASNRFEFKRIKTPGNTYGQWLQTFKFKNKSNWLHGTSAATNYGDYYPIYYVNHIYASFGIFNQEVLNNTLFEITYDHS